MEGVFANRTLSRDFVFNELEHRGSDGCNVYIAAAFFTEPGIVLRFVEQGCSVWMVVRLGFPTSPSALEAVMRHPNVHLRVYTSRSYHPKLYIFGSEVALVGSANLTRAAIMTNQEVMVSIASDDGRFVELMNIFDDYWADADVPTPAMLKTYSDAYSKFDRLENEVEGLADKIAEKLGNTAPKNIDRGEKKASKQLLFLSHFRKAYQESVAAFNVLRYVYSATGYRKASEDDIPLRLEIDSFISFVRDTEAKGESWKDAPYRTPEEQEPVILALIDRWKVTRWPHFEDKIVGENYPRLMRVFASDATVKAASDEELFDALATLHSFHDRYRFFGGGLKTWREVFPKENDPAKARASLTYLVFGSGDVVERMANMIYEPMYKLNEFGQSNTQELVGWCNREDLPVLNGRTTKILRFFGSKVRQVN